MHPSRAYVLYNLLTGLSGSTMIAAYIPLLLAVGMSLSEVALVNVVFWGTIVVLEIPTGMLADGKSRRFSVSCGIAATAIGFALYAGVRGFWTALLAECMVGVGNAFISGALSAWLTDSLRHRGEGERLRHTLATGSMASALAMVVGGFASALWLAPTHPRICWLLGSVFAVAAFICVRFAMTDDGEPVYRVSELEALRESVAVLKKKTGLMWATVAAVCWGLVIPFNLYWVPFVKSKVGDSAVAWSWVPMYAACAVAGFAIRRYKVKAGHELGGISIAVFITGLGLGLLWLRGGFTSMLMLIVLHEFGRGLFMPLLDAYTQQHVEEHYRATYGSLQSFLGKMGYAAVLGITTLGTMGKSTTVPTIATVFGIAGAGLVLASTMLWIFRPKNTTP